MCGLVVFGLVVGGSATCVVGCEHGRLGVHGSVRGLVLGGVGDIESECVGRVVL